MLKILNEILSIANKKIIDTIYAIQCNIMHERQGRGIDYSIYSEVLGNAHIVKSEIEFFVDAIQDIINNLEVSLLNGWTNPYVLNDFGGIYDDCDKKKDVYEYLCQKWFNDNELLSLINPSKFIIPFIDQNFKIKNIMRQGFEKFFPNIKLKKIVKLPNGENIISDYTEKDKANVVTNTELEGIESLISFESFIENANILKSMLENKYKQEDILIFIRDN